MSSWRIFEQHQLLDIIVECTNDKAQNMNSNFVVTREMICTYIGVLILVRAIWSESEGCRCVSQFILHNVCEQITTYLQYDVTGTREIRREQSTFAPMGAAYDVGAPTKTIFCTT
jgi:hypothetical protein